MLLDHQSPAETAAACTDATAEARMTPSLPADLLARLDGLPLQRRRLRKRQHVFRAGQPAHALYLVNSGFFKTSVLSPDGREKITGFRMRGDLLGLDALDTGRHGCDAVALDTGEVWVLPLAWLRERVPDIDACIAAAMAGELRRDWAWMLALGTLGAEQRVVAFLLDSMCRLEAMGFSRHELLLRMTRAELGNFLAVQLETVTRALSKLQAGGMIGVDRRQIRIHDRPRLEAMLAAPH